MNYADSGMEEGDESFPLSVSKDRIKVRTPKDIVPLCELIVGSEQECVMVFCLDGNNQVSSRHWVTVGLANQSQMHPREIYKHAIRNNAVSIVIVHNHPSGNLEPSESDLIATRRMVEVSKTIGIPVLDHVIVSPKGFLSIRDRYPAYFG
jgi:DNA repair protein RadC